MRRLKILLMWSLGHLESQRYDGTYARKRMETADGDFGEVLGIPCAEVFIHLVPEVYYHLPLEERTLKQGKGWTDRMHRVSRIIAPYVPMPEASPQAPGSTP